MGVLKPERQTRRLASAARWFPAQQLASQGVLIEKPFGVVWRDGPSFIETITTMHTVWVRLNAVVFFGLTVLLCLSCLAAVSKFGHSYKYKPGMGLTVSNNL